MCNLATDLYAHHTSRPSATSVASQRILDVTGAQMTEWRRRPIGSRDSTRTGRRLSPGTSANHTSPRRGAGSGSPLPIECVVIDVIVVDIELDRQVNDSELIRGERLARVRGHVAPQLLGADQSIEGD